MIVLNATVRLLSMSLMAFVMVGCESATDEDLLDDSRPVTWYGLRTYDSSMSSVSLFVMSEDDMESIESQTGVGQSFGLGVIYGVVRDSVSNTPLSGVQVLALNDAGVYAGTPYYQNTDASFSTSLTTTTTSGGFIILNVSPGRVNLRCTAGASGNVYVSCTADEATYVDLLASTSFFTVTWSGITRNLTNVPSTAEPQTTMTGLGTALPFPLVSDVTSSDFDAGSVNGNNTFLIKLSKTGFVDTFNTFTTGTSGIVSPQGDLLIVSAATLTSTSFKPASLALDSARGIIRGAVSPSSGSLDGYVVSCTNVGGVSVGTVRFGSAADASPDDTLTATSATGVFYVYNVPPGTVLVACTKDNYGGNTYVDVVANSVHVAGVSTSVNGNDTITVSGTFKTFSGDEIEDGPFRFLGTTLSGSSDSGGGYSISSVPAHQRFLVRTK